jgi:MGT family glycosyltransferase
MSTYHVAFISFPHFGHVNATLPIVSTLVRRGIRVTYVTSAPYLSRVNALGAEGIGCQRLSHVGRSELPPDEVELYETSVCKLAEKTLSLTRDFYRHDVPDLFVYDILALAGKVLSHELRVPAIRTSPFPAFESRFFNLQMRSARLREWAIKYSALGETFLARHGVEIRNYIFHREPRNILLAPRELDPASESLDPSCVYAGRCPTEQIAFGNWNPSKDMTKPVVLIADSTTRRLGIEFFKTCIEALRVLDLHVIMAVRKDMNVAALGELPDRFEIAQGNSATRILPFCDVLIFMGGSSTAAEAAYYGVPLVLTPQGDPENTGNSEHLEQMGVGIHIKHHDFNQSTLRQAVQLAMSDLNIKSAIDRWQASIRRQPGAEEIANLIEDHLSQSKPSITSQ